MLEENFEGSLILEKLAAIGLVEEFYEAVDADDLRKVTILLRKADVDEETIQVVIQKIGSAEE